MSAVMAISPPNQPPRQPLPLGMLLVLGLVCAAIGLYVLTREDMPEPRRAVTQQITLVQPPPPPPPPPKEEPKVQEPQKIIEPVEEAVVQEDVEQVSEEPSPDPPSLAPAGLNRPADIGSDSFRLAAGKGGGLFGRGGGGGGSWDAFVATHVRRALRADPRTSTASGYLEVLFSIDPKGRFERAELQSSTGDPALDAAIREVLSRLPPLSRGRPADVQPLMVTGINIRSTEG